jgi:hypothetical protein
MQKKITFNTLLFLGIFTELLIFLFSYLYKENFGDVFRYSARYSGRLSLIIYLYCFYVFYISLIRNKNFNKLKEFVLIFGILHVIHFGYLAMSVYLNELPIIPVKITGGAIAYMMIIIYPFIINKINRINYHLVYFYYVGIVFLVTYLARIRGDFEGADPEKFHVIAFIILIIVFLKFGFDFFKNRNKFNSL